MKVSDDDRRALFVILGLLVVAAAARWLERPQPVLEELVSLDVAALEAASREARSGPARALAAGERIDPNRASAEELQRLPGVGPATAQAIVAERDRAPFRTATDLQRVRGIGPALAARLAEHVSLPEGGSAGPSAVPAGGAAASPRVGGGGDVPAGGVPIDLNRATAAELQTVPGIGPALAARIVARRDSLRGFRDWAEVDGISGIGPALLARLQERSRLGPATR